MKFCFLKQNLRKLWADADASLGKSGNQILSERIRMYFLTLSVTKSSLEDGKTLFTGHNCNKKVAKGVRFSKTKNGLGLKSNPSSSASMSVTPSEKSVENPVMLWFVWCFFKKEAEGEFF